jgi:sortase A
MRVAAAGLALAATAVFSWLAVTLVWGEPLTAVRAARAQTTLRHELARDGTAWRRAVELASVREQARAFRASLREGDAVGTIAVPRLHLRMVVVEGTAAADLARGPGHYRITALPGAGGTVAIAGHRTTYLQPFRHLDRLHIGDRIYLTMPYGTFRYSVYARKIVGDHAWSILRRQPFEKLVLSACHPLYSASHRIVVFARLSGQSAASRPA